MEPHVTKRLVDSAIFRSENAEVGVLIDDDDRAASTYPIIKQSDVKHASGKVKKIRY
jgi:hypothetical protein